MKNEAEHFSEAVKIAVCSELLLLFIMSIHGFC